MTEGSRLRRMRPGQEVLGSDGRRVGEVAEVFDDVGVGEAWGSVGSIPTQGATAADPALVRLREKLVLDFHDGWPQAAAELEVALVDGRVLKAKHDAGIPSADIAAQGDRLAAKFDVLSEPALGAARSRELREMIFGLDGLADVGALARLAAA